MGLVPSSCNARSLAISSMLSPIILVRASIPQFSQSTSEFSKEATSSLLSLFEEVFPSSSTSLVNTLQQPPNSSANRYFYVRFLVFFGNWIDVCKVESSKTFTFWLMSLLYFSFMSFILASQNHFLTYFTYNLVSDDIYFSNFFDGFPSQSWKNFQSLLIYSLVFRYFLGKDPSVFGSC